MKRWLPILLVLLAGCAFPGVESFRPRTLEIYVEEGKSRLYGSDSRVGVSLGFEFTYPDEWEPEEEE
jgi:hypothetical protein